MKKNYMTPMVSFQNFSATETVTEACKNKVPSAMDSCTWTDPELGEVLFVNESVCEYVEECYFPSVDIANIFTS